jgi:hypothetical protein
MTASMRVCFAGSASLISLVRPTGARLSCASICPARRIASSNHRRRRTRMQPIRLPGSASLRSLVRPTGVRLPRAINSPSEANCLLEPPPQADRMQPIRLPGCPVARLHIDGLTRRKHRLTHRSFDVARSNPRRSQPAIDARGENAELRKNTSVSADSGTPFAELARIFVGAFARGGSFRT